MLHGVLQAWQYWNHCYKTWSSNPQFLSKGGWDVDIYIFPMLPHLYTILADFEAQSFTTLNLKSCAVEKCNPCWCVCVLEMICFSIDREQLWLLDVEAVRAKKFFFQTRSEFADGLANRSKFCSSALIGEGGLHKDIRFFVRPPIACAIAFRLTVMLVDLAVDSRRTVLLMDHSLLVSKKCIMSASMLDARLRL